MRILLTGAAGFVGFHCARALLRAGHTVIGVDSLNDYYDPALKQARLAQLTDKSGFTFNPQNIAEPGALRSQFETAGLTHILHLAAQAGVRYSLEAPRAYIDANLAGHLEVLELARHCETLEHCVYASSSSVYGERTDVPFSESDTVRTPASLYAATKIGGEMLSESYARLYGLRLTGLRFFTVYGPWGRPDMAYWIFAEKMLKGEPITLFAPDAMQRDFTFIDDISGVMETILRTPADGHAVYNLGNTSPVALMDFVREIERACGVTASLDIQPRQPGDVSTTYADIVRAQADFGFAPQTPIRVGLPQFVDWYRGWISR
ncbi:NAD-dependent epimerase/dehydratase family protein [Algimonas porphyrae]|nr:NAD-dependent epimerase/dehydratase family protein [Algimonas porphyrae]